MHNLIGSGERGGLMSCRVLKELTIGLRQENAI